MISLSELQNRIDDLQIKRHILEEEIDNIDEKIHALQECIDAYEEVPEKLQEDIEQEAAEFRIKMYLRRRYGTDKPQSIRDYWLIGVAS